MNRPAVIRRAIRGIGGVLSLVAMSLTPAGRYAIAQEITPPALDPAVVVPAVGESIRRGLVFLAVQQRSDGSYGKSRWERFPTYPTAMSALAGMAFLASGDTPTRGRYAPQIRGITHYLLDRCANSNGYITDHRAGEERPMYSHAFAMTFLAHVHGQEGDELQRRKIKEALQRAVRFTMQAQTDDGGWGYTANHYQDEGTLTVTQLQGLRSCRDAGIHVPREIVDSAVGYIARSTNRNGSVRYRPRPSQWRPGVTCAALVTLWNAGRYADPRFKLIADFIRREIGPRFVGHGRDHKEYVMYYLAQARFYLGGTEWPAFYRRYAAMLVDAQRADGSWEGSDGGEIYGTAIALVVLQLPHGRLPVLQR